MYAPTTSQMHTPTDSPAAIETILGYEEGCAPPCWHGIIPGISTKEEVVQVLGQLVEEGKISGFYAPGSGGHVYADWPRDDAVVFSLDNGKVEYVQGDFYTIDFRVKQVIERFGEPEGAPFTAGLPEIDLSCEELEESPDWDPVGGFLLLYPSKGVTFSGYSYYYGFICPEMLAIRFYYYQPRSLSDAFSEGGSPVFGRADFDSEDVVEWHGYGDGY